MFIHFAYMEVATKLTPVLQAIFTHSQFLITGKLPAHEDWRNVNISPIFMKKVA